MLIAEAASGGMSSTQATALTTSLQTFGTALLDNFVLLVPALVGVAVTMFVIRIVRKKLHS